MEGKPIGEEVSVVDLRPRRGTKIATGLALLGLCAVLTYALLEHRSMKQIAADRDELSAALSQERGQVEALTAKLNSLESAPVVAPQSSLSPQTSEVAPQPSLSSQTQAQVPVTNPSRVHRHHTTHAAVVRAHHPAEDSWRQEMQSKLTEQQKKIAEDQQQIQETRESVQKTRTDLESNLKSTHDELSGSIAKTHEELVALERKGERHYYEFNLQKSKQFQATGPIRVSLRKSNSKHEYCDLALIVNDSEVSKKHVNLYEPVVFYPEGSSQPLEVVINTIGKDAAGGYVSAPKFKTSELAASASSSPGMAPASAGQTVQSTSTAEGATLKRRAETQE